MNNCLRQFDRLVKLMEAFVHYLYAEKSNSQRGDNENGSSKMYSREPFEKHEKRAVRSGDKRRDILFGAEMCALASAVLNVRLKKESASDAANLGRV